MEALVGTFSQEKALVGAFSVIVKSSGNLQEPSFEALLLTPRWQLLKNVLTPGSGAVTSHLVLLFETKVDIKSDSCQYFLHKCHQYMSSRFFRTDFSLLIFVKPLKAYLNIYLIIYAKCIMHLNH